MAPHALLLLLHPSLVVSSAQSDACATFELRNSTGVSSSSPGSSSKVLDRVLSVTACCAACGAEALCSAFAYHPKGQGRGEDEQCKLVLSSSSSIQTKTSEGTIAGFAPSKPTPPPTVAPTMAPIAPRPPLGFQPNIIFIQTDDQDVEIGGLTPMPKLRSLLGERGASLRHWFVNTPVCCPSRTETLSGRYHHNMRDAPGQEWSNLHCGGDEAVGKPHACGCMRMNCSASFERKNYANYLQAAGYTTAYFGKYLNPPAMDSYCHNKSIVIPGWSEMLGMCNTAYYNINWVDSEGKLVKTGSKPTEYSTSIVGNKTIDFIERMSLNQSSPRKPFFVSAATRAPHGPSTPAPWYMNHVFAGGDAAMRSPNWNNTGRGDDNHVDWVTDNGALSKNEAKALDRDNRNRWLTLMSVDDLVEAVVSTVDRLGIAESTYIFYSSDHGYHLGHLNLPAGKRHFYEFDIRVPFLAMGPRIAANSTMSAHIASNVDLAPTFMDLAGIDVATHAPMIDGKSVLSWLLTPTNVSSSQDDVDDVFALAPSWRTAVLIEFSGLKDWPKNWPDGSRVNDCPNNTYRGLRIVDPSARASERNMMYSELTVVSDYDYEEINWRELYDLDADPYQLSNLWFNISESTRDALAKRLAQEWRCVGAACL